MGRIPGADVLIPYMHKNKGLAHDQGYEEVKKISWSDIKGQNKYSSSNTYWVLVRGERGMGAIAAKDSYQALAVVDGEVESKASERGGTILDWLKDRIGKLQSFYVGKASGDVRLKRSKRQKQKPLPTEEYVDINTFTMVLMRKFKPLWVKALKAAAADIKGFVGTQLKNDSYEKANKKIERLKYLDMMINALEDGEDPTAWSRDDGNRDSFVTMRTALHNAVLMAAHHYYPEKTGGFKQRAYGYGRSEQHNLTRPDSISHLFNDIRSGETSKLGTILGFFKKGLISG